MTDRFPAEDAPHRTERTVPVPAALVAALVGPLAASATYPFSPFAATLAGLGAGMAALAVSARRPARSSPAPAVPEPRRAAHPSLKSLIEAIPDPAILIDRSMNVRDLNDAATKAFGAFALGEAITLRFRAPDFRAVLADAAETGQATRTEILESRTLGRAWAADIRPMAEATGEPPAFLLVLFRDRTAERQIGRMRTDFVANASHELRTPLASVIGFIETLQGPARDDPAARDRFLGIMREQAARMSRLIDDLLSLSQIEMKRPLRPGHTVDLVELLEDVGRHMAPVLQEGGLALETAFEPGPHVVEGERDELLQVFSNLVENACKYAASGRKIVLSLATDDGGGTRAGVRDFGPGIPAEHVPRLTERFYRVDVESSRTKRGTGLGLSIVRNILLRHSARLVIESDVGKGSTFCVVFPRTGRQGRN